MKTTERFDRAVTKLYNAFHKGRLDAYDCHACAVGNMCDGYGKWGGFRFGIGTAIQDPIAVSLTMYSPYELGRIEGVFMNEFPDSDSSHDKETQFKGLCAVVEYLCELDNIPNVMDFTKLFEYDKENQPIHQL